MWIPFVFKNYFGRRQRSRLRFRFFVSVDALLTEIEYKEAAQNATSPPFLLARFLVLPSIQVRGKGGRLAGRY